MKYLILLMSLICIIDIQSKAQYLPKAIEPYRITISYDKTSNLIFPASIKSIDRGNENILAQKAPGVDNILQLKAAEANMKETNVTVVTEDGHFYSFTVNYNPNPGTLNYSFVSENDGKAIISGQPITTDSYNKTVGEILHQKSFLRQMAKSQNVWLRLNNIFIKDNLLWLQISISNNSLIPFHPSFIRLFIEDKKQVKNTAIQQSEITSLVPLSMQTVSIHSEQSFVFVCHPFSIPVDKHLMIETGEASGSRQLTLELNHRIMKKIKSLPRIDNN